jgi:hypothetical protein
VINITINGYQFSDLSEEQLSKIKEAEAMVNKSQDDEEVILLAFDKQDE